jgi:hypothetical protein
MTDYKINTRLFDQQPAEDANQIILHIIILRVLLLLTQFKIKKNEHHFEKAKRKYLEEITRNLMRIDPVFLNKLLEKVSTKYFDKKKVFLYAPEGGSASLSLCHVAHNMQWDAISEIKNPPRVQVHSSFLPQQYTGVANDRRGFFVHGIQISIQGEKDDLLIVFAQDLEAKSAKHLLLEALERQMNIFVITTKQKNKRYKKLNILELETSDHMIFGDLAQIIGHIMGRLIRINLLIRMHLLKGDPLDFLIRKDLAQLKFKKTGNKELFQRYARLEKKWMTTKSSKA